jgi:ABC-2 type transport system ATP-binding protein
VTEIAIQTVDLSCHFGEVRAVDQVSLQVQKGIVFGFLGPNGSGKTTTIRLLLGLLTPKAGRAEVLGFDASTQSDQIRERTGALLEHHGLYERLSAADNLDFFGRIYRLPRSECQVRIKELLGHFGLWERRHERVGNWSRGMKQKVAIARTLLHRPPLVFLDEPTAGLDPIAAVALREDLARLVEQEGTTVFLNTHNLPEAEKLCAQVGVIRDGKLLSVGSPAQLQNGKDAASFRIAVRDIQPELIDQMRHLPWIASAVLQNGNLMVALREGVEVSAVIQYLVNAKVQVDEVVKNKVSLEDVFLKMMEEDAHAD